MDSTTDTSKIKAGKVIVLLVPNKDYSNTLINFIKSLPKQPICYVTINKSYDALVSLLHEKNVDDSRFFFIDCVTKTIVEPKSTPKNCIYIPSPKDLTGISLAIAKVIKTNSPLIIVDSLSTLAVYHSENVLTHFSYDLISKAGMNSKVCLVLSIADADRQKDFAQKIEMKADKVIELK